MRMSAAHDPRASDSPAVPKPHWACVRKVESVCLPVETRWPYAPGPGVRASSGSTFTCWFEMYRLAKVSRVAVPAKAEGGRQ